MALSGYRLHLKRLGFLKSSSSIRTIKYQLGNEYYRDNKSGQLLFKRSKQELALRDAIKYDYERLYGDFNLKTYRDNHLDAQGGLYSLKEFWLDCLRAGAVMKHNGAKMLQDLRRLSGEQEQIDSKQKDLIRRADKNFFNLVDFDKLKTEVILQKEFRKNKTNLNIFRQDTPETQLLQKEILAKTVGRLRVDQDAYWQENYGIDKSLYFVKSVSNFCLLPQLNFNYSNGADSQEPIALINDLETVLIELYGPGLKIEEYIGLSDNQGGLSQIFNTVFDLLYDNNLQSIKDIFESMSPDLWRGQETELDKRLQFLSQQARRLGRPKLVNNWADYRTDIGGKITSWLSNSLRQDDKIAGSLFGDVDKKFKDTESNSRVSADLRQGGHRDDLAKILKLELDQFPNTDSLTADLLQKCQDSAGQLQHHLNQFQRQFTDNRGFSFSFEALEDYRNVLAKLRTNLNSLYQSGYADESRAGNVRNKSVKDADKEYKALFKELERITSFIGYAKSKPDGVYQRYVESMDRLKAGLGFIETHLHQNFSDIGDPDFKQPEQFLKILQNLLDCYRQSLVAVNQRQDKRNRSKGTNIGKQILQKALNTFLLIKVEENLTNKHYIWQSPYKKRQLDKDYQLKLRFEAEELPSRAPDLLDLLKINWSQYDNVSLYLEEWLIFTEIEKVRTGLLARTYDITQKISLDDFDEKLRKYFPKIEVIPKRFKENEIDADNLNTILQQAVFSEIRGILVKMTTRTMIARYVVQPIGSETKFKLATEQDFYGQPRSSGQNYYIHYDGYQNKGVPKPAASNNGFHYFADKPVKEGVLKSNKKLIKADLIKLNSSRYQLQFLDNALAGKWADFKPTLSSYSLIYEETYHISWSDQGLQLEVDDHYKLFVAIPFAVSGNQDDKRLKREIAIRGSKFLGIDVGEYGLATCVLDVRQSGLKVSRLSFIDNRALRIIRDQIADNKSRQRGGTFSMPNTRLKRLRESAITEIRNQVHALILKNSAIPVYEYSISNFETGSGKVSKIYNSVKQSDIFRSSSVNDLERNLVWGKGKPVIALEISAYATSYSCLACYRSLYTVKSTDSYRVKAVRELSPKEYLLKIAAGNDCLYGFAKDKSWQPGDSINFPEAKNYWRKYARPPYKNLDLAALNLDSASLNRYYDGLIKQPGLVAAQSKKEIQLADKLDTVLKYYAGSQAIFRCPFENCHNSLADADLQAAIWIALKGYIKYLTNVCLQKDYFKKPLSGTEKDLLTRVYRNKLPQQLPQKEGDFQLIPMEDFLKIAQEMKIQPIGFDVSQRLPEPKLKP